MRKQITKTQEIKKGLIKQLLTKVDSTEFKDSPLGKIPKSWEVVKISKIADINKKSLPNTTSDNLEFYYIDLSAVKSGTIEFPSKKIAYSNSPSRARRILSNKDIIMATVRPNLLGICYADFETNGFICSTGFALISHRENSDGQYIYQNFYSENVKSQINKLIVGSNYPSINFRDVKNIKIPLPPLPEQKKIAEILSTVDAKIEIIDQQVSKTQELKKGLMQRLLTKGIGHTEFKETKLGEIPESWEVLDLSKLSKVKGRSQKYTKADLVEEGQGALAIGGTQITKQNKLNFSKSVYFSWKKYNESPEIKVEVGNIVFAQRGTLGRLALIETLPEKATINPSMVLIKNIKCNKKFLFYYLCSTHVQNIVSCISASTAVPMISQKQIKGLKIAIPSNDEQSQIANILGSADEKLTILAEKKTKYQELKKGLMQQLLTGKIRVNHLINKPSNI